MICSPEVPNHVPGSPVSEIGQGEIRGTMLVLLVQFIPLVLFGPIKKNPRSEIGQGEIRGNFGPSTIG